MLPERELMTVAELEDDQVISADVTTELRLNKPLVAESEGYYELRASVLVKTIHEDGGTRLDVTAKRNGETLMHYTDMTARENPPLRVESVQRDYVFGHLSEKEFEDRLEKAIHEEGFGGQETWRRLATNHLVHLDEGEEVTIKVRSGREGTVLGEVSGVRLTPAD